MVKQMYMKKSIIKSECNNKQPIDTFHEYLANIGW